MAYSLNSGEGRLAAARLSCQHFTDYIKNNLITAELCNAPSMGVSSHPNLHQGHGGYVALFRGTLPGRRQCLHARETAL